MQKLKSLPADEAAAGRHGGREGLRYTVILCLLNRLELAEGFAAGPVRARPTC